jgi:hypothetical protein
VNDKFTMIHSMSYTPNGLFNHTAAIYQIATGYTTDSQPLRPAEPPDQGLPNFGPNIVRLRRDRSDASFVMLPVRSRNPMSAKAAAPVSRRAYDPYTFSRTATMDPTDGAHPD